jgi:hypothetical protein
MTSPNGEGAQSGATDPQSGVEDPTGTGTSTASGEGTQSGAGEGTTTETVPKSELEATRERMRAADQRAARFEQELRQLRDKDLPEAEKFKRDFEESQTQVQTLQKINNELALKVAFLEDNSYTWQNPKRAMQLIDLGAVEIQADGSVSGLKDALKALATSDPYLLKQEATTTETPPAGTAPGNNGSTTGKPKSGKDMALRVPALNTRIRR